MTRKQRKEICKRAIDYFGVTDQTTKAIEEMGELITEIARYENFLGPYDREEYEVAKDAPIIGEMADVIIMLEQMQMILGITDEDLNSMIAYKLGRLEGRMENETD